MKRIALVLALLMALAAVPARADSALDAAFASGCLTLVETETAGFDLAACEVVFPDEFWAHVGMDKPSDAELAALIGAGLEAAEVFSVSPAGNSALIATGGVVFALNGSTITELWPNEERGVPDRYENMRMLFQRMGLRQCLGSEGIVWSHDGRYAVLLNIDQALMNAQYVFDPMLIDTVTGDIFLTATYGTKMLKHDDAGVVAAACFSEDDHYLYYTFYGNLGESKSSLLRYDMESGETEFLYNGDTNIYYPALAELRDGSFIIISDVRQDDPMGVARLAQGFSSAFWAAASERLLNLAGVNEGWHAAVKRYSLPAGQWRTRRLAYSAQSGYAVVIGADSSGAGCALQVFRPDEDFEGFNRYWLLTPSLGFEAADDTRPFSGGDYLNLCCARLSPDGHYMLLQAGRGDEYSLLLVRMADMAVVPVTGVDGALQPYGTPQTAVYRPGMEWNCDEILLLVDGEVRSYRIDTNA